MSQGSMAGAVCERCGAAVRKNEEGRITCSGCNMATDNCTCGSRKS